MLDLLGEAGRGLDALFSYELAIALVISGVVVVGAVGWAARREGRAAVGWPLLVVASVALGVRGRAILPLLAAAAGWALLQRFETGTPAWPGRSRVLLVASMVTGLGLFGTLPDIEEAVAFVAALAVVALATLVGRLDLEPVTGAQVGALLGMLVWVCLAGDGQRARALLAGLLCVAMLAVVAGLLEGAGGPLLLLHVAVTVAASRWVGLADDTSAALLRAMPVVVAAVIGAALVRRFSRPPVTLGAPRTPR